MDEAAIMGAAEIAVDGFMLVSHLVLVAIMYANEVAVSCGQWLSTQKLQRETLLSWVVFLVLMCASLGNSWFLSEEVVLG
jgi:hypothetical protein